VPGTGASGPGGYNPAVQRNRFVVLATGSKGNCAYLATPHAQVLIDCGVGPQKLARLCRSHGINVHDVDAVFITHNHIDHAGGLGALLGRCDPRVYCHEAAAEQLNREVFEASGRTIPDLCEYVDGGFFHRDIDVLPVRVCHDAEPTVMYKFYVCGKRIGVLTDLGSFGATEIEAFGDCDILVLEANHDLGLLKEGPYPEALKARIRSKTGHLSNEQAAQFITGLTRLPAHLMLGHLSEVNNRPELASAAFDRIETGRIPHTVIPQGDQGPPLEL